MKEVSVCEQRMRQPCVLFVEARLGVFAGVMAELLKVGRGRVLKA